MTNNEHKSEFNRLSRLGEERQNLARRLAKQYKGPFVVSDSVGDDGLWVVYDDDGWMVASVEHIDIACFVADALNGLTGTRTT